MITEGRSSEHVSQLEIKLDKKAMQALNEHDKIYHSYKYSRLKEGPSPIPVSHFSFILSLPLSLSFSPTRLCPLLPLLFPACGIIIYVAVTG